MRKRFLVFASGVFGALLLLTSGCSSSMYEDSSNWALIDSDTPVFFADYDLIFLYPTCEERSDGGYLNWVSGNTGRELRGYVRLVISAQFGSKVRVFSPFIPMLNFDDYNAIIDEFKKENRHDFDFYHTKLKVPIDYMVQALEAYFTHYNSDDHPFVIYGQEQGALVLYEAMKRCSKVTPDRGFVAAYMFGMPGLTKKEILNDFGKRGIRPAVGRDSISVIAICNLRSPGEPPEKTLAMPGGAVINPLNWRTDATLAGPWLNRRAVFFNHRESNPTQKVKWVPHFCGAAVDPDNGIVDLVDVPKDCPFKIGSRQFDSDLWGIFSGSVSGNAQDRVSMYRFVKTGVELPK